MKMQLTLFQLPLKQDFAHQNRTRVCPVFLQTEQVSKGKSQLNFQTVLFFFQIV